MRTGSIFTNVRLATMGPERPGFGVVAASAGRIAYVGPKRAFEAKAVTDCAGSWEYFGPYHEMLAAEIARLRHLHPVVMLDGCHSIRSEIPQRLCYVF
jgi:hypothetical protein